MPKTLPIFTRMGAIAALAAFPAIARADLPVGQTVTYEIHQDPGDLDSPVIWQVEAHLTPQSRAGNTVKWLVDQFTISKVASGGTVTDSWSVSSPHVDTSDGLWTIEHADPMDPKDDEFAMPPLIADTAPAVGSGSAMEFTWQGHTGSNESQFARMAYIGYMDFSFLLQGQSEPVDAADNEPVSMRRRPDAI